MLIWNAYPPTYRAKEVQAVLAAVSAGECVSLVGLSGAGKSNLTGFLAARMQAAHLPEFLLADCNRLTEPSAAGLWNLLAETLGGIPPVDLRGLEKLVSLRLEAHPAGVCLMVDRFEALSAAGISGLAGPLRALRDSFKYSLTYVTASRRPLDPHSELAELFYAHTIWVGPLSGEDAVWSAAQYAARRDQVWDMPVYEKIIQLSWGYPSLLRAVCEAYAGGCPLEWEALRQTPAVQRRVDEFWADQPGAEDVRRCGLEGHPLLHRAAALQFDPVSLTAAESRLLAYLQAHAGQVCGKDDLITAIWPDEGGLGLRDDSLAQLVHRLRDKIGAGRVQTVPGRGYRYLG